MASDAIRLEWNEAPGVILGDGTGEPRVVCVSGPVGSGKTTLADRLLADQAGLRISTDDYLPDYDRTPEHLRDEPQSSHLDELAEHLAALLAGRPAMIPTWSFHEHKRVGGRSVDPASLIVVEGIHALHAGLDLVRSTGVLVEASTEIRWQRWEILESTGQRGWGVEKARAFFESVADPTFARHRTGYESRADYIVLNDRGLPSGGSA